MKDQAVSGHSDFLTEAYNLNDDESIRTFYEKWADDYDQEMVEKLGYTSPFTCADLLQQYLNDTSARILDIGCGTGLTSLRLKEAGYNDLHGLDLSPDILAVAKHRGIYQSLIEADLNQPLAFDDGHFDAVISTGTFTHAHIDARPLAELLRIIRPEGLLVCTVHADLWQSHGFEQAFAGFEEAGQIRCLRREMGAYYQNGKPEGWFCVYQTAG